MSRRGFPQAHTAIPNLAPMVDVVMVILIFFMLGASFVMSEGFISTRLPSQAGPGGAARVSVVPAVRIALSRVRGDACGITLMGQALGDGDFAALETMLKSRAAAGAAAESRVVIQSESDVRYADVVAAMDACERAGFARIQFGLNRTLADNPTSVSP